ncbi:MAG: EthD domain-containing protein [Aestuariivita sp.]|uniref:EthD domain-containing protein n=1 Tax=Aestuariivita sp. TaxID=1872407 RepID=UPI003BAFFF01
MIKLTFCLRRKPQLSRAEFQTYWRETHGPIVEKHRAVLGFVAYNQIHTIDDPMGTALADVRGAPPAYDGVAEMIWASREDLDTAMTSAEGRAAGRELLADEKRFIDLANSPVWLGDVPFSLTSDQG